MDKKLIERIVGEEIDAMEFEEAVTEPYGKQRTKRIVERSLARIDAERGKEAVAEVRADKGLTYGNRPTLPVGTKLYLAPQPAVPEGYALVPVEPTEEMMRELTDPFIAINGDNRTAFNAAYRAMLAAAAQGERNAN